MQELGLKLIYEGKLLSYLHKKVRLPNGFVADLEVIRHPGAALVVPFLSRDKIILLEQFRPVIKKYLFELPAGTLNRNETPLSCARREIIEETGYRGSRFTKLGEIYPVPGYSTERIVIFKAEGLIKTAVSVEEDEIIKQRIVTRSYICKLFRQKKIVDAKTICALSLCGLLKNA